MKKASEEQSDKDLDLEKLTECTAEKKKLKSAAYNGFVLLCTAKEEYAGYVKCTTCLKAFKHDIHGSGTSHLTRHMSTHGAISDTASTSTQRKLTTFITRKKNVDPRDSNELRSALAYFCSADLRPFSVVEGIGLQKAAQCLISIGHKYGNIPIQSVLPSRTTVSETCRSEAVADRGILVQSVNTFIENHGIIGVTTDMWQDSYKKKNYVAVTVHMMTATARSVSRVLQVSDGQLCFEFTYVTWKCFRPCIINRLHVSARGNG